MQAKEIANRFKIRCSAIGRIMAGQIGLTEKQLSELSKLIQRQQDAEEGKDKPLTANMLRNLEELRYKHNNPELPQGAKTYCLEWIKQQPEFYNRTKQYSNKYTEKGLIVEDNALDLASEVLGYGLLVKNEQRYNNDFIEGTPDNLQPDHVIDVKSSWDFSTFPLFEEVSPNKDYDWQLEGYMDITGKDKAKLIYCLIDTPINIIEREARHYSYSNGYGDLTQDLYDEFLQRMTYKDVPDSLKVKVFEQRRDEEKAKQIHQRVKMCRKFIEETVTKFLP